MMKYLALAALLVVAAQAAPAVTPEMVATVNSANAGWTAHMSPRFADKTMAHVAKLCGTVIDDDLVQPMDHVVAMDHLINGDDLPTDFDARTQWPECPSVAKVRDQADCGSCWAFGSTESFNSRLCIASKGTFKTLLSPQDTASCCDFFHCFSMGCNGGQPNMAWKWFTSTGVVTGGEYDTIGDGATCWPYQVPECSHHVTSQKYPACDPDHEAKAPSCAKTCSESNYATAYADDKHKADSSFSLSGINTIKQAIMTDGPVTATLTVYGDFPTYKSGVYKHVSGDKLGGHAVLALGWGVEDGQEYWLIKNSWNEEWGDGGFFKIALGNNECGIESGMVAGKVSFSKGLRAPVSAF